MGWDGIGWDGIALNWVVHVNWIGMDWNG